MDNQTPGTGAAGAPGTANGTAAGRVVAVNVAGTEVNVEVREDWSTIAPVTTAARWLVPGYGKYAFDCFEVRDSEGRLLDPCAPLGDWLDGQTLWVNLPAGVGA